MDPQESTLAKTATKVEIIFEKLAVLETKTFNIRSNSKEINEKLLGAFPTEKSDVAETVSPSGILQLIIDALNGLNDNLEGAMEYLASVVKEIEKK